MTTKINSVDCIVPFYNEGKRIFNTVHFIKQIKGISNIICVDDGSADASKFKTYSRIKTVHLVKNQGKTAAIKEGLKHVTNDSVLLFDADLKDCSPIELEDSIEYFLNNSHIDMLILRRMNDPIINKLIRTDIVLSGQRLLRTRDLRNIFNRKVSRFQLELAVNDFMLKNKKQYYWIPLEGRDVYKREKVGFIKGELNEFRMYRDLLNYRGIIWYFMHLLTFCRDPLVQTFQ